MTALSLICPLRDDPVALRRILPYWLQAAFDRIILVDYGSRTKLTAHLLDLDPRLVLVRVENAPYWKPGQAANLAIDEVESGIVLKLDLACACPPGHVAALRTLRPGHFAIAGAQDAIALWRQDWARLGGYHEYLSGRPQVEAEFRRRLAGSGVTTNSFAPDDFQLIGPGDPAPGDAAPPGRLPVPPDLARSVDFLRQRNHVLAQIVPWQPERRLATTRRVLAPRHVEITLAPPALLEQRTVELASLIAATPFVAEKEKWMADGANMLFFQPEIELVRVPTLPALA